MSEVLVIGAGPAGLLAAWIARQRGARVKVMATGIGTTHVSPGWISVLNDENGTQIACPVVSGTSADERGQALSTRLKQRIAAHPEHPYALAGLDALQGGLAALRTVGQTAGIRRARRGTRICPA